MTQPRQTRKLRRACWLLLALLKSSSGFSPPTALRSATAEATTAIHPSARSPLKSPSLHLVTEDEETSSMTSKKRGPFRRAFRKILRKKRPAKSEKSMHMLTKEQAQQTELSEDFVKGLRLPDQVNADFILQNFQNTKPSDVFPPQDVERRNVLTTTTTEEDAVTETVTTKDFKKKSSRNKSTNMKSPKSNAARVSSRRSKYEGGTLVHRMTRSWFQNLLTGIIQRRSKVPPVGLVVKVAPRAVMKKLCRGQFRCDATIDFSRVVFRNLRLTGGSLEAKHMTLGVGGGRRYVNAFDIHFNNCTLTEDDLFESSCIRNGLARLLVRILSNAGVKTLRIQVTSVNIVPSGKISCSGQADTVFGSKVSFEVRSGIGMSSRGHVVEFPGLEVSLGPSLGVFVPVVPDIDLDIGHNAILRDIFVDGRRRRVTLSASTTVTPTHTMKLQNYSQHKDSYSAQCHFDVGRWVTNLGNFTN